VFRKVSNQIKGEPLLKRDMEISNYFLVSDHIRRKRYIAFWIQISKDYTKPSSKGLK
jgi:hypothetical protein